MAEYVVKMADERGRMLQQIEHGYSETEVRDRYSQQGFLVYSVKPRGMFAGGDVSLGAGAVRLSRLTSSFSTSSF